MAYFTLYNFCQIHKTDLNEEAVRAQFKKSKEYTKTRIKKKQYRNLPDLFFSYDAKEGGLIKNTLTVYIFQTFLVNY